MNLLSPWEVLEPVLAKESLVHLSQFSKKVSIYMSGGLLHVQDKSMLSQSSGAGLFLAPVH